MTSQTHTQPSIDAEAALAANGGSLLALTLAHPDAPMRGEWTLGGGTRVRFLDTGIVQLEPDAPGGMDLVLSAGIHGNETAPIEIVDAMMSRVLSGELPVRHRTLVILGHPPAMLAAQRFVGENLNRLFPTGLSPEEVRAFYAAAATPEAEYERRRAQVIRAAVDGFFAEARAGDAGRERVHYDLHTAIRGSRHERFAVFPHAGAPRRSLAHLHRLAASGLTAALLNDERATTLSNYSFRTHDAHAFTVELGQVNRFGHNDLARYERVRAVLADLLSEPEPGASRFAAGPTDWPPTLAPFVIRRSLVKRSDAFRLAFAEDLPNFTAFSAGALLAVDGAEEHRAQRDGEVVVFPNAKVAIGQRAAVIAAPVSPLEVP